VTTIVQTESADIKTAYKLNKENRLTKPVSEINNLIRGLSPYPAAWCFFSDKGEEWNVKIYEAKLLEEHSLASGSLICTKKEMKIAVENGYHPNFKFAIPVKRK
jgi:methionyl-tRNA formyltransferase